LEYDFFVIALTIILRSTPSEKQFCVNDCERFAIPPEGNASMKFTINKVALSFVAAGGLVCVATAAGAGGKVALTDGQLDSVIAAQGGPFAEVAAGAQATGLVVSGSTSTFAITNNGGSPFDGSSASASGVAVGSGSNGLTPGTSSTNVATFTEAPGNFVVNLNVNRTVSALGTTIQGGFSSSVGFLIPGLQ
jgi:hypothetical protein